MINNPLFAKGLVETFESQQPGILWLSPADPSSQGLSLVPGHCRKHKEGQESEPGEELHPEPAFFRFLYKWLSAGFIKGQVRQGGIITKEMRFKHQQLDHKQDYAEIQTSPLFSAIKNVTNEKLSC